MIKIVAEQPPEREQLYQYGLEKKEEGTPEKKCLELMRWYNGTKIATALSSDEVAEIHADIFSEDRKSKPLEAMMEEDPLARFHHFNDKGKVTDVFDAEIFEYLREKENIFVIGQVPYIYRSGAYVADLSGAILKTAIKSLLSCRMLIFRSRPMRSTGILRNGSVFEMDSLIRYPVRCLTMIPSIGRST